jgi:hypothetical protein
MLHTQEMVVLHWRSVYFLSWETLPCGHFIWRPPNHFVRFPSIETMGLGCSYHPKHGWDESYYYLKHGDKWPMPTQNEGATGIIFRVTFTTRVLLFSVSTYSKSLQLLNIKRRWEESLLLWPLFSDSVLITDSGPFNTFFFFFTNFNSLLPHLSAYLSIYLSIIYLSII